METVSWITSAVALVGVFLNIKKDKRCFMIWAVTNFVWTFVDMDKGIYAQAALQLVYCYLSLYGLATWGSEDRKDKPVESKPKG